MDLNDVPISTYITISLGKGVKKNNSSINLKEFYIVYPIETRLKEKLPIHLQDKVQEHTLIWRRYSDFELLKLYLQVAYPQCLIPPLPEKRITYAWQKLTTDTTDPNFIDRRQNGLFLQMETGWSEGVNQSECWKTRTSFLETIVTALSTPQETNIQFEKIQNYSEGLHCHLSTLLHTRAKMVNHVYALSCLQEDFGLILNKWSSFEERKLGINLENCGRILETASRPISAILREEEYCIDNLKEYLFYTDSLNDLCQRQAILQHTVEQVSSSIAHKKGEIQKLSNSNKQTSLLMRLLSSDSNYTRSHLFQLQSQIKDEEQKAEIIKEQNENFIKQSLKDVNNFHFQKIQDLTRIIQSYANKQIDIYKHNLSVWTKFRNSLNEK